MILVALNFKIAKQTISSLVTCETNCHFTGWVNDLQGPFTYIAPDNYFIRGVVSFHDNKAE